MVVTSKSGARQRHEQNIYRHLSYWRYEPAKDGPEINYTDEQMKSLRSLLDDLRKDYP